MCCAVLSVDLFKLVKFALLTVEELHDGHACNVFLEEGIQVGHSIADIVEGYLDFFLKHIGGNYQKRECA